MRSLRILLVFVLLVVGSFAEAGFISVGLNFIGGRSSPGGGGTTYVLPGDIAGVVPQDSWNNLPPGGSGVNGTTTGVLDSTGALVPLTVTWSGIPNTWSITTGTPADANARLMNGYVDTNTTSTTLIEVDNIPYLMYDVIVYFGGDVAGRSGAYGIDDGISSILKSPLIAGPVWPVTTGGGTFIEVEAGQTGNYTVFRGLSGSSFDLTATAVNFRAPINAIQIVNIPEPATLSLLALGGLALVRRRKK